MPHVALRYMTRFSCVGSACEETCCAGGWQIAVDKGHHGELVRILSRTHDGKAEAAEKLLVADKSVRTPGRHADIKLKSDGSCSFLESDRLCSLYRRFGAAPLPNTCEIFPRHVQTVGDRVELLGTLGCPETARLALFAEDAFALDPLDVSKLPRRSVQLDVDTAAPYPSWFDDIRAVAFELLGRTQLPLTLRMFLLAYAGERTRGYFHRDAAALDGARLAGDLGAVLDPAVAEKWRTALGDVRIGGARAGRVLLRVLAERLADLPEISTLRALMRSVLENLVAAGAASGDGDRFHYDPEKVIAVHGRRRAHWEERHRARVELALTNLARQFWMKEPYTLSPDLRAHAQKLILRVALVRFLVFSHPLMVAGEAERDERVLDKALVDVVQKLARALEHNRAFADGLDALLESLELRTLAEAVFLLAV